MAADYNAIMGGLDRLDIEQKKNLAEHIFLLMKLGATWGFFCYR